MCEDPHTFGRGLTRRKGGAYDGDMPVDARTPLSPASDLSEEVSRPVEGELTAFCPRFHHAVELVGRRWTGAILRAMLAGRVRFSDLAAAVPGLSDRLLSERLKELTAEGLIERTAVEAGAGRVEYHLTAKGRQLTPVIESLSSWAEAWITLDPQEEADAASDASPA